MGVRVGGPGPSVWGWALEGWWGGAEGRWWVWVCGGGGGGGGVVRGYAWAARDRWSKKLLETACVFNVKLDR